MRDKIGVSAAVAWARHGGLETTHLSHLYAFLTLEMIPASVHDSISPLGASAVASEAGSGSFDPAVRLGADATCGPRIGLCGNSARDGACSGHEARDVLGSGAIGVSS